MNNERVLVELTGANVPYTIDLLSKNGFELYNVSANGFLSASMQVPYGQFSAFSRFVKGQGDTVTVQNMHSFRMQLKNFFSRPIFSLAILLIVLLSLWLPTRVLFITVEGCDAMDVPLIMAQAERCGVYFGASRKSIRSEIVKNILLESIPDIRWAGVTTRGCVATLHITKDSLVDQEEAIPYSNIVARADGVVISGVVTSGVPNFRVGDAVKTGQVLVSGYQDHGALVRLTRSKGEIFAQTERCITAISPAVYAKKERATETKTYFSLLIGKKRINLSKGSGISYTGCDKIYSAYYLTLPGGLSLPLALQVEQLTAYTLSDTALPLADDGDFLQEQSDAYVQTQMISGRAKRIASHSHTENGVHYLTTFFSCVEMIGREQPEELDIQYGKSD